MKKVIKVPLSTSGLNQLSQKINTLKEDLRNIDNVIVLKLSEYVRTQIQLNYNKSQYTDGNDDVEIFMETINNKSKVGARGTQVFYREYGTGIEGEMQPHPNPKQELNGYNTGKTIRRASETISEKTQISLGQFYWTYLNNDGEIVYTTGIPAGAEVYNASVALQKEKMKIVKKEVGDVLSKI